MKNNRILKTAVLQVILLSIPSMGNSSCSMLSKLQETIEQCNNCNNTLFINTITEEETTFLITAATINSNEIQLGELALEQGMTPEVKTLGAMMVDAHKKLSETLTLIATKKKITIPISQTDATQSAYSKLHSKTGTEFDTEYCNMMVSGHKEAIKLFEKAFKVSTDPDIKEWIKATLPELRKHLSFAIQCQKKSNKIEITQE